MHSTVASMLKTRFLHLIHFVFYNFMSVSLPILSILRKLNFLFLENDVGFSISDPLGNIIFTAIILCFLCLEESHL